MEDLEEAIAVSRRAAETTPVDHPDLAARLSKLGNRLGDRYYRTGKMEDLEEAIAVTRQAIETMPSFHPDLAGRLNNLGHRLGDRYSRTGKMEDLEEAIAVSRRAVETTSIDHPDLAARLDNLGHRLGDKYSRTGKMEDLEEAIALARRATETTPSDLVFAACLNNLGVGLGDRYSRTGKMEDLEEAIAVTRQAIEMTPIDHPDLAARLGNLGLRLGNRYSRTGEMEDLEEAIAVAKRATETTTIDHPALALRLHNLGIRLGDRYSRTGKMEDLEEAIAVARRAVETTPIDHPDLASRLNNLGVRLGDRYSRTGKMEDIEEAMAVARRAVETTPIDHPDLAFWLSNLGNRLGDRYSRTGKMEDLEEAIAVTRQAIETMPSDHPDLTALLINLGNGLGSRHSRTGKMEDLEEAVAAARRAIETTPIDHPALTAWLHNLGVGLGDRYSRTGRMEDLEEAIAAVRRAIETTPIDHPDLAARLNNLGVRLSNRYATTGKTEDLEEAIALTRRAIGMVPTDHPDLSASLNNLGSRLGDRYSQTGKMEDLEEAIRSYIGSSVCVSSPVRDRLYAYRQLSGIYNSRQDWSKVVIAGEAGLELVPLLVPRFLVNSDKQYLLSSITNFASEAAAAAMELERPFKAIQFLEQGRGVLAGSLIDLRSDMDSLKSGRPDLAQRFHELQGKLQLQQETASQSQTAHVLSPQKIADIRQEASAQFESLIEQIRLEEGFSDFLLPPGLEKIQRVAAAGPVVVINIASRRCDALVVKQNGISSVSLPKLSAEEVKARAREFAQPSSRSETDLRLLEWLWDSLACPVLEHLNLLESPAAIDTLPHLWWIPTGALGRLPIHMAGYHFNGSYRTVLDHAISSYSTSLKALIRSYELRSTRNAELHARNITLVAVPNTGRGLSDLPCVEDEVAAAERICTRLDLRPCRPPLDRSSILAALRDSHIFHFAGHGHAEPSDPSQSKLVLPDGSITVDDLFGLNLLRTGLPFLAYLSACRTGEANSEQLVDESIHLISGCQLAGFKHVIGTLRTVNDAECVLVAEETYRYMAGAGMSDNSVSAGLHEATRRLRAKWIETGGAGRAAPASTADLERRIVSRRALEQTDTEPIRDPSDRDAKIVIGESLAWVAYCHFGI